MGKRSFTTAARLGNLKKKEREREREREREIKEKEVWNTYWLVLKPKIFFTLVLG